MQQELNHTVQSLLGCKSLDEVPKSQLEGMVLDYPYSALVRLLHAKKLQILHDPGYADAVSRTALYFNNPHWLNYQLWNRESQQIGDEEEPVKALESASPASPIETHAESLEAPVLRPWHEPVIRALDAESDSRHPESLPVEAVETAAQPARSEAETVGMPSPSTDQPVVAEDGPLLPIEPYYTIDYFASQGIQLTEAESQDNLGRKLKSFTDWLKTMKKVHTDKQEPAIDPFSEERIKEGAELSNDLSEVWTEAMAEVYLKQGLKHKAMEVYRKLSLLNPGLSATFAAKIAELND